MSDDRSSGQPRSWLEKLSDLFSDDPRSRQDIKDIVREAAERSIVDNVMRKEREAANPERRVKRVKYQIAKRERTAGITTIRNGSK